MALFNNGYKKNEGSRSNTALVRSGHMSPAEEWLVDPRFKHDRELSGVFRDGVLFTYQYGGPGMEEVVIAKGRMVGVHTPIKDFVTKKFKTVLTLPGMALNGNTVGMVPFNITRDYLQENSLAGGNQASIITLDYVVLPYMPTAVAQAMTKEGMLLEEQEISINNKMPWGAVIGKDVQVGDYVKSSASGRLVKWVKGTDCPSDICGQVLSEDRNQEPWGWSKWMLWNENEIHEDAVFMNRSGVSNLPSDAGYPYDPTYANGNNIYQHVHSDALSDPTGIPGLHDGSGNWSGFGKNDTEYTDRVLGTTPTGIADNTMVVIQALDFAGNKLVNLQEGVTVKVDGVNVEADKMQVNYKTGQITLTLTAAQAEKEVTATYKAFHYGTSSYLDFKGVEGAMHVLLKK